MLNVGSRGFTLTLGVIHPRSSSRFYSGDELPALRHRKSKTITRQCIIGRQYSRQVSNHRNQIYISARSNITPLGAAPPVEFLPFLKYIPFFLSAWKARCESIRQLQRKLYFGLLGEVEKRVAQGLENGCFVEEVSTVACGTSMISHSSVESRHPGNWYESLTHINVE